MVRGLHLVPRLAGSLEGFGAGKICSNFLFFFLKDDSGNFVKVKRKEQSGEWVVVEAEKTE